MITQSSLYISLYTLSPYPLGGLKWTFDVASSDFGEHPNIGRSVIIRCICFCCSFHLVLAQPTYQTTVCCSNISPLSSTFVSTNFTNLELLVMEEAKSCLSMMTRSRPETQDRLSLQQPLDDPLDSHLLITNHQASSGKHSELLLFLCYFQESCSLSTLNKPSFSWSHLFLTLCLLLSVHASR